jgi:sugar lactone lactonase YvrE
MPEPQTLLTGLAFGESPRWHDDRLWVSDWGAQEVVAVDLEGNREVIARVGFPSFPMCIDWLPDGRLLIVSGARGAAAAPGARRLAGDPCRPAWPR